MAATQSVCPVCANEKRTALARTWLWSGIKWSAVRCLGCSHRYVDPLPDDDDMSRMYSASYFGDGGDWICQFWSGSYIDNEEKLRAEAEEALVFLPPGSGRLLEIGCAGGFFLDEARKRGFAVHGIELNAEMADFGRDKLGLSIETGSIESIEIPKARYDVVVAQDVLEHLRAPRRLVDFAAHALTPGGRLLIRGPLEDDTRERMYGAVNRLRGKLPPVIAAPPYHLQGFTVRSFRRLFAGSVLYLQILKVFPTGVINRPTSLKNAAGCVIDAAANVLDRLSGRGNFLLAVLRNPG